MLTQIITLWNKAKYGVVAGLMAVLYLLGHQKGKQTEQSKTLRGTLNNVQKAKNARDKLSDPDYVKRLHNKYKR